MPIREEYQPRLNRLWFYQEAGDVLVRQTGGW
jgi:hypothetical protein